MFICLYRSKIDTTQARKEMEAREIKVVSEAQILEETMRLGKGLVRSFKVNSLTTEPGLSIGVDYGNDTLWEKTYYLFDHTYDLGEKYMKFLMLTNTIGKKDSLQNPMCKN